MKNPITTHILDTSAGAPAEGISVRLEFRASPDQWKTVGSGTTNADGRIPDLIAENDPLPPGTYRLTFETGAYFQSRKIASFYPYVQIVFDVTGPDRHYHVPLLLNPYGYSTYRGS